MRTLTLLLAGFLFGGAALTLWAVEGDMRRTW